MSFVSSCSSHQENASTQSEPQILDEQGLTKEANDRFWSAVKPVSNLPLSHYRLGRYYQKGNKHELAINEFTKAVTLNKEYVQAYNALGMSYDHLLNCEGAEWAYSQALQYGAGKAYVYNNFGCSRLICDKNDQAIALFSKAQEIDGSNTRIRNNLRLAEIRGGYQKGDGFSSLPEEPLASAVENSGYVEAPKPGMKETEPVIGADKGAPFVETVLVAEKKVKPEMADKPIAIKTKSPKLQVAASGDISKPASCGVEISNGNGVTGMAKKGAAYLRKLGFSVKRITNAPQFTVQDTKIYYRDGCLALAESVAKVIPGSQEFERVNDLGRAGVGVRLTLGGDMVNIRFPEGLERHFAKK